MSQAVEKYSFAARLARFLYARSRTALLIGVALTIACAAWLPLLHINNDYRAFFDDSDRFLETTDWLNGRQGLGDDVATVIYLPGDGDVFSLISILQVEEVTTRIQQSPYVLNVESWLERDKLVLTSDGSYRRAPVMFGSDVFDERQRAILREDLLSVPAFATRAIGRDGASAAFYVFLNTNSADPERASKLEAIQVLVDEIEADLRGVAPGDTLILVGSAVFDHAAQTVLRNDVRVLMPIAVVLIFLVLAGLFNSLRFAALGLVLISAPTMATAGLLAGLGVSFSTLAVSGLLLVGTLAVADVLHVASSYYLARSTGEDAQAALTSAIEMNLWAIFGTSLTTGIGQIALLASASPPIRVMGLVVSVGIWLALLMTLLMLPYALTKSPHARAPRLMDLSKWLGALSALCTRRAWLVVTMSGLALAGSAVALSQSTITDSLGGWFSTDTEFRRGMDVIARDYVGADAMTVALEAPRDDQLAARRHPEPHDVFERYAAIRSDLEALEARGTWYSPVDAVEATRARIQSGEPTTFVAGEGGSAPDARFSAEAVAQSGLMTRLAFGSRDFTLWRFDAVDASSFELLSASEDINAVFNEHADGRSVRMGGLGLAFGALSVRNFESIVASSLVAFALISATMFVVLCSFRLGMVALAPNIAPITVTLGVWGLLVGEVNMAVATVFSVSMGLVVDDTIHILAKYRHFRRAGEEPEDAVRSAVEFAGPGLMATTLVIAAGFFLLGTSDFLLTAQKATLVGAAVSTALAFDLTVLPAILILTEKKRRSAEKEAQGVSV